MFWGVCALSTSTVGVLKTVVLCGKTKETLLSNVQSSISRPKHKMTKCHWEEEWRTGWNHKTTDRLASLDAVVQLQILDRVLHKDNAGEYERSMLKRRRRRRLHILQVHTKSTKEIRSRREPACGSDDTETPSEDIGGQRRCHLG